MINHMSLVNAAIRPSGESYRERLFNHEVNHNPSEQIDELLKDNNGFLVFQEDVIKFLQDICGLSGSDADNVRRAIGRKQMDRLQAALPEILEGYCNKSDKPREIAEEEAKVFLQIIEDSSNYMFGYNHSTGYSMIGYTCAMLRYYYPLEFCTSLLQNPSSATAMEDTQNATQLAHDLGFEIHKPKFRYSGAEYRPDKEHNAIYKGISSIKNLNRLTGDVVWELREKHYPHFIYLLIDLKSRGLNKTHIDVLIKLNFFEEFGEINHLLAIRDMYELYGKRKQMSKAKMSDIEIDCIEGCYTEEKPKTYVGFNPVQFIINMEQKYLDITPASVYNRIKWECIYIGYTDIVVSTEPDMSYVVQLVDEDRYGRVWLTLYQLNNGKVEKLRCDKKWVNEYGVPNEGDTINAIIKTQNKRKKIDNVYIETEDTEDIIKMYTILNEVDN